MIAAIKEGMGLKTCMRSLLTSACAALLLATGFSIPTTARADTITYYHNDFLGSPVVATNSSGAVLWRQSYKPYGERMANEEGSFGNKIRYTSRHEDDDTDLVYMGARYYDPVTGRFMGVDSIRFDERNVHSFNRYSYANNNPYRYVDPDGKVAAALGPAIAVTGGVLLIGGAMTHEQRHAMGSSLLGALNAWDQPRRSILSLIFSESGGPDSERGTTGEGPKDAPNPKDFSDPKDLPNGWGWRGKGQPGSREGAYHNPQTGESLHDDSTHPEGKAPHWTYTDPKGTRWDNFGDGWLPQSTPKR